MAAAAAGWDLGSGSGAESQYNEPLVNKTIAALDDLASTITLFSGKLFSKEQLDERQRKLAKDGGPLLEAGTLGEQAQFRIGERIGEGTFCVVFRGERFSEKPDDGPGQPVALKFELKKTDSTQLRNEFRMYKKFTETPGIPKIHGFGEVNIHKVLVMDLLGPSLETVLQQSNRRFSVKTVAMLAKQMISRLQVIHTDDVIYRDIKPENFLIGVPNTGDARTVFLVDYGMAKLYRDPQTKEHIPYGEAQSLSGTARYMSINAHCRRSQSRRDDLEALGHVFMYFLRGNLPWQGVKATKSEHRYELMREKKEATSIEDLCRDFPPQFAEYLKYARSLPFDGDPDYDYLRGLFDQVLSLIGTVDDGVYDWLLPKGPVQPVTQSSGPNADAAEVRIAGAAEEAGVAPEVAEAADTAKAGQLLPAAILEEQDPAEKGKAVAEPPQEQDGAQPLPPSSPPGKRRRSEFASELRPPVRMRPKKTTFSFYDDEAQQNLSAVYRGILAKRYSFHREVGGNTRPTSASSIIAAATAMNVMPGSSFGALPRFRNLKRSVTQSVISPAFTETLDKTLALINSELEDLSDKFLQGGDWSGVAHVWGWFEKLNASVQQEKQRLCELKLKQQQMHDASPATGSSDQTIAGVTSRASFPAATPGGYVSGRGVGLGMASKGEIVVDVEELVRKDQASAPPGTADVVGTSGGGSAATAGEASSGLNRVEAASTQPGDSGVAGDAIDAAEGEAMDTGASQPEVMETGASSVAAAAAAAAPSGAQADAPETELVADNGHATEEDDSDGAFSLVYRTASGTRKVLRMSGDEQPS